MPEQEKKDSVERRISISKVDTAAIIGALVKKKFIKLNEGNDIPTRVYWAIVSDEECTEIFVMTSTQLRNDQEDELKNKTEKTRAKSDVQRKKRLKDAKVETSVEA